MFAPTPRPKRHGFAAAFILASFLCAGPLARTAFYAQSTTDQPEAQQSQEGRSALANSPALEEFRQWVEQFKLGGTVAASEQTGRELAAKRRAVMARLVREDPRSAVELAVPARVRQKLPEGIQREVEQEVSGYGDYLVLISDEADPQTGEFVRSRTERKVVLGGKTYHASVYGRKLGMTTKLNIPLRGVVVGDRVALAESPVRVLDADEQGAAPAGQGIDAEVGGRVMHFETREQLDRFEEELKKRELTIGPRGTGKAGGTTDAKEADAPVGDVTAASPWTQGAKTVLLMRVDFSDAPGEPVGADGTALTTAYGQSLLNTQVNEFYKANSYNATSITGTVTKVLRMPRTANYYGSANDFLQLLADARTAATRAGYNIDSYDLDIVAFKRIEAYTWAGQGYIGAKGTWLNGYFTIRETSHELGHNFGLNHANLWKTTNGTVIGTGTSVEYANPFDAMGGGHTTVTHHFGTWFKTLLDWLPVASVKTVTAPGTYRLQPHDLISSTGLRALKIQKDWQTFYWVEFRQAITEYPAVADGAVIYWGYSDNVKSNLLDMTPSTSAGADDAPLAVGKSFTDTREGLRITATRKTTTSPAELDVTISYTINLSTLALNPTAVIGGAKINGTVTLNAPAPSLGAVVQLSDDLAATSMPASVTIQPGARSQTFTISTKTVAASQTGTFTASYRGVSKTSPLTVDPITVSSLKLSKPAIGGGGSVTGTVTINTVAPSSGVVVILGDNIAAAKTPPSVTVPAGAQSATFTVTTDFVDAAQKGTVTASRGGVTRSVAFRVDPTALYSLTLKPAAAAGGGSVTATVKLNGPAPPAGVVVDLSDDIPATTLPASVTFQGGESDLTFTITSQGVDASQSGYVTAKSGAVVKKAALTLRPLALYSLKLNPASVAGGNTVTGTVSLDGPAGPSGEVITLSDDLAQATTPASLTIPAGAKSATFRIETVEVDASYTGTVTATRGSVTKAASLTVRPVSVRFVDISQNPIPGGNTATATVYLDRTPKTDTVVTLSDDLPATTMPDSVTVPAGALSVSFDIATTFAVPSQRGKLTAAANTESKSYTLSVVNTGSQPLANPGFEIGLVNWEVASPWGPDKVIYRGGESDSHTGQWLALLGGLPTASMESLYQPVTIPADARAANLNLYLWVYTLDTSSVASDRLEVRVEVGGPEHTETVAVYTNLDKTGWYVLKTVDLSPYRGQTIKLVFWSSTDQSSTWFYIDDVTLDVIQ